MKKPKPPTIPRIKQGLMKIRNRAERSACAKFAWWRMISDKEGVTSSDEVHSLQAFFVPSVRPVHPDVMEKNLMHLGYSDDYIMKQLVSARTTEAHRLEKLATMDPEVQKSIELRYERATRSRERQIGIRK